MKCGMQEIRITPPLGSSMPGYLTERKSTGVKDELYTKALVIESDSQLQVFISVDALFFPTEETDKIRERLQQELGVSPEQVMISATHTHTGPPIRKGLDGSSHEDYVSILVKKMGDAAVMAYQSRRPAKIGVGTGHEGDISFNRRYWMKDGTLETNPGFNNPNIEKPAGPIDPEVTVVRIDDLDDNPIGVVVNFACHTDTVGGTEYCADYPGEMSRMVKKVLGSDVVSLFMIGACGDINHHNFMQDKTPKRQKYDVMGRVLAAEVLKVREKIQCVDTIEIACTRTTHRLELRRPTKEEVEAAEQRLQTETNPIERFFAEHILKADQATEHTEIAEIQVFRVGDWAVVGLPGEIFVDFGLELKEQSPFSQTIVNTLCNGSIYGYVCTREAYNQGGYEPRIKLKSRTPVDAGEQFVKKASVLLNELYGHVTV